MEFRLLSGFVSGAYAYLWLAKRRRLAFHHTLGRTAPSTTTLIQLVPRGGDVNQPEEDVKTAGPVATQATGPRRQRALNSLSGIQGKFYINIPATPANPHGELDEIDPLDRKSTRLNSSHRL